MQRALSCVSPAVWVTAPALRQPGELVLELRDAPLRLPRKGAGPLWFQGNQNFGYIRDNRYRGEWKVRTDGYAYTLAIDEDLNQELIAWHWHPTSRPDTHLHVGRRHPSLGELGKFHVPSGRVAFEEVVLFVIEDLGVCPARDDWRDVLNDSLSRFRTFRTWS
jgi:hypothetical protein